MNVLAHPTPIRILLTGLLVITTACSDDPEASDYDTYSVWSDSSADFSSYKTFGFVDFPEDQLEDAPGHVVNNNARIQQLVAKELKALGLTEIDETEPDAGESGDTESGDTESGDSESDVPDLLISSLAYTEDAEAWYYDCVSGFYWWGYYGGYSSCAWVDVDYVEYKIGTILIPVGDTETETVVFMGMLQGIVDSSSDAQKRLEDGIGAIFNKWPE